MAATDQQVQNYVDQRIRPHAQTARLLKILYDDDLAAIDDVYAALATNPTWTDQRTDGPPHWSTPSDVLAIDTFINDIRDAIKNNAQYPIVLKACVHGVTG